LWLVVGLGNPGDEYAVTRHNAGFLLVRRVAGKWGVRLRGRAFKAKTARADLDGRPVMLALPQTFMNRSGVAVREMLAGRDVSPARLVVVYDDLDIPLGEIRVRTKGSPGTHKGMISVVSEIGTRDFPRIRVGIGPLPPGRDAADYVLSPFRRNERPLLDEALDAAEEALDLILAGEAERAMTRFNKRVAPGSDS
jgi:PTH1 family peptidyl-tRNA hydrolase